MVMKSMDGTIKTILYPLENNLHPVDWGHYLLSDHDYISEPVCWLPVHLDSNKYNIHYIKDLVVRLKDEINEIWEGPYIHLQYWKFRFTTYEDRITFKLIIE